MFDIKKPEIPGVPGGVKMPEMGEGKIDRIEAKDINDIKETAMDGVLPEIEECKDLAADIWSGKINLEAFENQENQEQDLEDEAKILDYYNDLLDNSEYKDTIEYPNTKWEKVSPEEVAEKRQEFNNNREKLIAQWEEENGKEWPRYEEDVYLNGTLIRKKGQPYDAHHIQPLGLGGQNTASNLTPVHAQKHFDKQGIHAPGSPYSEVVKNYEGRE